MRDAGFKNVNLIHNAASQKREVMEDSFSKNDSLQACHILGKISLISCLAMNHLLMLLLLILKRQDGNLH